MDEKFNRIPVSVIHLDKDGTVIDVEDYNLDKVEPDLWAIKGLAASLLPVIREFYTHEENVQAFEAWLKERENNFQKHSKRNKRNDGNRRCEAVSISVTLKNTQFSAIIGN